MTTAVELTEAALDDLDELDRESRERIVSKLGTLPTSRTTISNRLLVFRLQTPGGDFRVIVDRYHEARTIYAVAVLERKHDYRELPNLRESWGRGENDRASRARVVRGSGDKLPLP